MSTCVHFKVKPFSSFKILHVNICLLLFSKQSDYAFQTKVNRQESEHGNHLQNENYHCP